MSVFTSSKRVFNRTLLLGFAGALEPGFWRRNSDDLRRMIFTLFLFRALSAPFSYADDFVTPKKRGGKLLVFDGFLAFTQHQNYH
jgi:hypothetical protein